VHTPAPDRLFAVGQQIPLAAIDRVVCARLGPARVTGNAQPAVFNRQVALYLAKQLGGWSTTKIGKFYHGRDHSTVCHAIRRIESMRQDNPELDAVLSALGREIQDFAVSAYQPETDSDRGGNDALLDDNFLDGLAERLADRLLQRIGNGNATVTGTAAGAAMQDHRISTESWNS
jgi:hypothetical protein